MRVLLLGATGYVGQRLTSALSRAGHEVTCIVRTLGPEAADPRARLAGVHVRLGDVTESGFWRTFSVAGFDAVVSALASRTGTPEDAARVDRDAHLALIEASRATGPHVVLVSAICVQRPRLAFQHAKLSVERTLIESGLRHSIVRPTAFFKSLSGQLGRVRRGEPFLVFGDGRLTASKPIGAEDLADFVAECLERPERFDKVLPIGGPGPALTPREQGELIFELCERRPKFRHVPVAALDGVIGALSFAGLFARGLRDKAELAKIGRYYATESMLVWDETRGRYDADATPSHGEETFREHIRAAVRGEVPDERREHAVF